MNIEISEVFVHYTDSISTEPTITAVGIAAIAPCPKRRVPNLKHWRIPTITTLLRAIIKLTTTTKQPKPPFLPDPMFQKVQKLDRFLTIS
ncbi:MAG: hypothetical protein JWO95_1483 [Verrucomicrobiales bacterium]|nr:hypothetical protein [Verrucomicrobiales bacterium]